MGLFDFLKRNSVSPKADPKPAVPQNATTDHTKSQTTSIEREHFSLIAPFEWRFVPSENPLEFEFRNQTLPDQLIVTVLLTKSILPPEQLEPAAQRLMDARLSAFQKLGGAGRALSRQSGSDQYEIRGIGRDETSKVQYAWAIRMTPAKAVTVAVTRYMLQDVGLPFEMYAGMIFDFFQVKTPRTVS